MSEDNTGKTDPLKSPDISDEEGQAILDEIEEEKKQNKDKEGEDNKGQDTKEDKDEFIEIDGEKFKADPDNEGEALKDDNDNPIPFEKPKEDPKDLKLGKQRGKIDKLTKDLKEANVKLKEHTDTGKKKEGEKEFNAKIEKLAKDSEVDGKFFVEFAKILRSVGSSQEKDERIDVLMNKAEQENQARQYDSAYDERVLPLVKAEYPNASTKDLNKIKADFKKVALDPNKIGTGMRILYRGDDSFRNIVKPDKADRKGGERTGGHNSRQGKSKHTNTNEQWDDPDFDWSNLSPEEFDKYSDYKAEKQGSKRMEIIKKDGSVRTK